MNKLRKVVTGIVCAAAALIATPALAQDVAGAIQVGGFTPIFFYSSTTQENDDTGIEEETAVTTWGITQEFALEGGYGLSEMFVLGGVLELGGTRTSTELTDEDTEETEAEDFSLFVGPKLDVMFAEGSMVRPFAGVIAGLASTTAEMGGVESSFTGFEVRVRGGVRWFPAPNFSIDPSVALGWATTSGEVGVDPVSTDVSGSTLSIAVLLGISGWIM